MSKEDWRKKALSLRDALTEEERKSKSDRIASYLLSSNAFAATGAVSCFVSFGSEADTGQILQETLLNGKALFCPRVIKHNPPVMECFRVNDLSQLQPGYAGILEPDKQLCKETLTDYVRERLQDVSVLTVMPGVAFSKDRDRIGYGGGCYDAYLHRLQTSGCRKTITAAVAFDCQVFEKLTGMEDHDIRPDVIFTETGLYR